MKQAHLEYNFGALPMKQTVRWLFYNYILKKGVTPLSATVHFPVLPNRFSCTADMCSNLVASQTGKIYLNTGQ